MLRNQWAPHPSTKAEKKKKKQAASSALFSSSIIPGILVALLSHRLGRSLKRQRDEELTLVLRAAVNSIETDLYHEAHMIHIPRLRRIATGNNHNDSNRFFFFFILLRRMGRK